MQMNNSARHHGSKVLGTSAFSPAAGLPLLLPPATSTADEAWPPGCGVGGVTCCAKEGPPSAHGARAGGCSDSFCATATRVLGGNAAGDPVPTVPAFRARGLSDMETPSDEIGLAAILVRIIGCPG